MSQGIQCWDASGNLVIDIGSYSCRYIGTYSVAMAAGVSLVSQSISGLVGDNSFAAVVASSYTSSYVDGAWYAKTKDGGFDIFYLPSTSGMSTAVTLTVDVYAFI